MFQLFLDEFSKQDESELKVMVLDNGAFHKAKRLRIPENILLIFLPPYSPELNPAEKVWARFKRQFTNKTFKTMDMLQEFVTKITKQFTSTQVIQTTAFSYIFSDGIWTTI